MATLPKLLKQPVPMPQALSSTRQRLRHWRLINVLLLLPTGILAEIVSRAPRPIIHLKAITDNSQVGLIFVAIIL